MKVNIFLMQVLILIRERLLGTKQTGALRKKELAFEFETK
jgi:hypothetical protein